MESIWGEKHDKKITAFEIKVEEIEAKYQNLFNEHVNIITGSPPDKLSNHYILHWDFRGYQIGFRKESYIPDYIQKEVFEHFQQIFTD